MDDNREICRLKSKHTRDLAKVISPIIDIATNNRFMGVDTPDEVGKMVGYILLSIDIKKIEHLMQNTGF